MKKGKKLYEGKAKIIYATNDKNLFDVVKNDKTIISKIPLTKLKKIFNYSSHFKNINLIFNRVFK